MTRPYSQPSRPSGGIGQQRSQLPCDSAAVWRERGHGGEVVAAVSCDWECRGQPDGRRRRLLLLPQRDWLLARIAAAPDLTLRAVQAELAERGVKVGYGTVWSFLASEGLMWKKTPCTPPSKAAPTSPARASDGSITSDALTRRAWSSSMRPGRRPT